MHVFYNKNVLTFKKMLIFYNNNSISDRAASRIIIFNVEKGWGTEYAHPRGGGKTIHALLEHTPAYGR